MKKNAFLMLLFIQSCYGHTVEVGSLPIFKNVYQDKPDTFDIEQAFTKENIIPAVIIGGGPAGLSAALYLGRARIHTVVFTSFVGGQLTETSYVENMPGIKKSLGYDIMQTLAEQVEESGAVIKEGVTIEKIEFDTWPFVLHLSDDTRVHALTLVLATGAAPRKLGIPGEMTYWGKGVSSCAVCDCVFFKNKVVYVVGGGDNSIEQLMQLSPYVKNVTLLVRKERMRAARSMQEKLQGYPNVKVEYNKRIVQVLGNGKVLTGLEIEDTDTNEITKISADGLFIATGQNPRSDLYKGFLQLNSAGYIELHGRTQATSITGVFAAGDVEDAEYRQAVVAASSGCKAALDSVAFLRDIGLSDLVEKRLRTRYLFDQKIK